MGLPIARSSEFSELKERVRGAHSTPQWLYWLSRILEYKAERMADHLSRMIGDCNAEEW